MVHLYYITIKNVRWTHAISLTSATYGVKKEEDRELYIQSIYGKEKKKTERKCLQNDGRKNEENKKVPQILPCILCL